jgi:formate/nitrite transporter
MVAGPGEPEGQDGPLDAVLPDGMARRAERTGVEKARKDPLSLLALAALAGAFIAFGAAFAGLVAGGSDGGGGMRLLAGFAFSLAYVLAIIGGAELFTTNNLMVMAWAHGRLGTLELLRAWGVVFCGNFVGVTATGALLVGGGVHAAFDGAVGMSLLKSAGRLVDMGLAQALILGILGNTLLCLGVWLTYSGRSVTDRILALIPPVAGFYALGLEHAIAVMFYLPTAEVMTLIGGEAFWGLSGTSPVVVSLAGFAALLAAVTVGNILGGGVLVAMMYWFIYLRHERG